MPYWETPERNDCSDEQEPQTVRCPHCGEPCDTLFIYGPLSKIVGCLACIRKVDAYEYFQEGEGDDFL